MFELIIGLIITGYSTYKIYTFFAIVKNPPLFFLVLSLIGLIIALICGLWLLIKGLIKVINNIKSSLKGTKYYASIADMIPAKSLVKAAPIMKMTFKVYIEEENSVANIEEEICILGYKFNLKLGSYVIVKYYKSHVKVVKIIKEDEIPPHIV